MRLCLVLFSFLFVWAGTRASPTEQQNKSTAGFRSRLLGFGCNQQLSGRQAGPQLCQILRYLQNTGLTSGLFLCSLLCIWLPTRLDVSMQHSGATVQRRSRRKRRAPKPQTQHSHSTELILWAAAPTARRNRNIWFSVISSPARFPLPESETRHSAPRLAWANKPMLGPDTCCFNRPSPPRCCTARPSRRRASSAMSFCLLSGRLTVCRSLAPLGRSRWLP